jgi:hypothetical protein
MLSSLRLRRSLRFAAVLLAIAATTACERNPIEFDDEPDIAAVRLSVGNQVVTINESGVQTPASVTVPMGTTAISAQFLRSDGQVETRVTSDVFRLEIVPSSAPGVTFTRTGPFAGTLNATTAGTKTVEVQAFHIEEGHEDFGQSFTFTVSP